MTMPVGGGAERYAKQYELARCVYACHQVMQATQGSALHSAAAAQLSEATRRFVEAGGIVKTGVGPLGDKGPRLFLADGREIPYRAGQALVEGYAQAIQR